MTETKHTVKTGVSGCLLAGKSGGASAPSASEPVRPGDEIDFFDIPMLRKQQDEARRAKEEQECERWDADSPDSVDSLTLLPAMDLTEPPVVIPGGLEGVEISISGGCIVTIKHASGVYWFFGYDRTTALVEFADGQGRSWRRVGRDFLDHILWRNDLGGEWAGQIQPLLDGRILLCAAGGDWTEILADGIGSRYCAGDGLPVVESDAHGPYRMEAATAAETRIRLNAPGKDGFADWRSGENVCETLRVTPQCASLWLQRPDGVSLVYAKAGMRIEQPLRGPEDFERIFEKMFARLDSDRDGNVLPEDIEAAAVDASFTGEEVQVLAALRKKTYRDGGAGILKSIFDLAGTERRLTLLDVRNFSRRLHCGLAAISILDDEDVVALLNEIRGIGPAMQGIISRDMLQ